MIFNWDWGVKVTTVVIDKLEKARKSVVFIDST